MNKANMTVRGLIEMLSEFDDDAEVRIATQPHFQFRAGRVVEVSLDLTDDGEIVDDERLVVFIGQGDEVNGTKQGDCPFLPKRVIRELEW